MKHITAIPIFLLLSALLAPGTLLTVGPGQPYLTIQDAVDVALPGDTIEVLPGMYPENVVVTTSPLTLRGARHGVDARARIGGTPDPATESVIAPVAGEALVLAASDGPVTVDGFALVASPVAGGGVVRSGGVALAAGWVFANNHVEVRAGATGAALRLDQNAEDALVNRCVLLASADAERTVDLAGTASFHGLHFTDNQVLRAAGPPVGLGLVVEGVRNLGASSTRSPLIQGNRFSGHAIGFSAGDRALADARVEDNEFSGNLEGMVGGPADCLITGNAWSDNTACGLRFTAGGFTADPAYGARDNVVEGNLFSGNGGADLVCDVQAAGTLASNVVRENRFLSPAAVLNHDAAMLAATHNYWNAADGPGGAAPGGGGTVSATVAYLPYYTDSTLTNLFYGSGTVNGDLTITDGQTITADSLTLAPAATLRVEEGGTLVANELVLSGGSSLLINRGAATIGQLDMQPGAVLDVVDGDLLLDPAADGNYHTISGTFTFFNCLGSLWINGNTSFSGDALGLASDIHVAPGSVMQVLGALTLDGCRIDCSGTFSLLVNFGATFNMTRCEVSGAAVALVGSAVTLRDNVFTRSTVTAFSTVSGGRIFHNVFNGGTGLLSILPGAVVTTMVEGWSNVASLAQVQNELQLRFRAPLDPTRTLDAVGNLFVQPGDFVDTGLDISKLNATTQAVETLLGFSTDYLTFDSLLPSDDWANNLYQASDESATIGKLNATVGLDFTLFDPNGTTAAGPVADVRMVAKPHEGRTRVFFRAKDASDHPLIDTRLTASASGLPYFKEYPFTGNAAVLTVDGTDPVFAADGTAEQAQNGSPVDVLADGTLTRIGTVTVTFDVMDELAGIDDGEVWAELTGPGGTFSGVLTETSLVEIDGVTFTRHIFTFAITAATPDGLYDVNAIAMDRSGNVGELALGTIEVAKNRITVTVQPQGLVTTPLTRDVTFTATDPSGAPLATWTVPVAFTGGLGNALLDKVPDGTAFLSAKMAWNLRVRLPVTLDGEGMGTNSFTGASHLRGGDFTGDNFITLADYNIMRVVFPGINSAADITGDGIVNLADYNILRANWLTIGEPL